MTAPARGPLFEWEDVGGIAVVRFTTPYLRDDRLIRMLFEQIDQLVDSGKKKLVMNFTGLEAFASYAIGRLITLNTRMPATGGKLFLCCLTPMVDEIVDIMNLRKRFNITKTEAEALEQLA
jgi:anti-sigma B factor antagonist